jgi:hypothetical protein
MKGLNSMFQKKFVDENIDPYKTPCISYNIMYKSPDFAIYKTFMNKDFFRCKKCRKIIGSEKRAWPVLYQGPARWHRDCTVYTVWYLHNWPANSFPSVSLSHKRR